ncbi:Protein TWIN LOV 1 [Linum perenne]
MELIQSSINSRYTSWAREVLDELPDSFTITDPSISGHPIVFASRGFLKMSGYSVDEVVGRNGRVFQGPNTCRRSVMEIREAVRGERGVELNLLNYRRDGTPFWMLFRMTPVFGKEEGKVVHFVAVQVPILKRRRNGERLCEEVLSSSCRREVCSNSQVELGGVSASESDCRALGIEEQCEAGDREKQIAATAIRNVLSVLTHYSVSTGRLVSEQRFGASLVSSSLHISLGRIKQSFVLMDPYLPDMPIVYASDAFLRLTGYARDEVLGHSCTFLNGIDTDSSVLDQVSQCLFSYFIGKDKSSFWNLFHVSPVRNATGKIEEGSEDRHGFSPQMRQLSVVGSVKVAVRSLSMCSTSSKSS